MFPRHRARHPLVRPLLAALLALALAAQAHASLMLAPPPYRPKDFAFIKKDGRFHLFYILHNTQLPTDQTETAFGHAISSDMYAWAQYPPVLAVRDSSWDNFHVWAPTIVERDSVYYMLYTGVTQRPGVAAAEQRIGIATSTDLMTWNRLDEPIFSCRDVPWAWCDTLSPNQAFRDPFVMPDPAAPGHWLMYYSTFPASDTAGMIAGVASSSGDLAQWTDLKPLWITNRAYSYNATVESPHVFQHGDLWFLFFTTNASQPISYAISHDPAGDLAAWVYRGRLANMLGIDTGSWYASEYLRDGLNEYFAYANYNRIEMYKMMWTGSETFLLFEPGNFHIQSLSWDADSVQKGLPATLSVVATGWTGREVGLQAYEKLPDGSQAPLAIDNLGIPSLLPLTADTTRFVWDASILHASGDTTTAETIVVQVTDLTAETRPLTVTPPPPPFALQGLGWSADSVFTGGAVTLEVAARNWSGKALALQAVEMLAGGGTAPLEADSLGLPSLLPLTADTTRFAWTARIRRPSGDTTTTLRLEVRTPDSSFATPALKVSLPPPLTIHGLSWSADSVAVGQSVTLGLAASNWNGQQVALQAVERLPGGTESPLSISDLGLPASLALTADTTRVAWVARIRRASGDTTTALSLVVRSADGLSRSPALEVAVPPASPPGPGQDNNPPDPEERLPFRFRMLRNGLFGDRVSFLVDLGRTAPVRLDLYDLQGRRVRTLADRDLPKGASVITWDGRDQDGLPMGRGLYFARIVTPFATRTAKVLLTRIPSAP